MSDTTQALKSILIGLAISVGVVAVVLVGPWVYGLVTAAGPPADPVRPIEVRFPGFWMGLCIVVGCGLIANAISSGREP